MKKFHNDHPSSIFYPALHMGAELKQKYQLTRIMLIIKKNILELYKIYCPKTLPAPYAPHAWYPSPPIDPSQPLRRSPCPFLQHKPVPQYSHGPSCLLHEFQHSFPKFFKPLWENNWFEWSSLWYDIILFPWSIDQSVYNFLFTFHETGLLLIFSITRCSDRCKCITIVIVICITTTRL